MSDTEAPSETGQPREPTIAPLVKEYYGFVWRTLLRFGVPGSLVRSAAEDVFVSSADWIDRPEHRDATEAWLFAFARRIARRCRRQHEIVERKRARGESGFFQAMQAMQAMQEDEDPYERPRASAKLHELLDELDDQRRAMFILVELEGMSYEEVAEHVDSEASIVGLRVRSARALLERRLEQGAS